MGHRSLNTIKKHISFDFAKVITLVVKASVSTVADLGIDSCLCALGIFLGQVIPVTYKLALQWLPWQALGVMRSALGLAGAVPVYCDWVR